MSVIRYIVALFFRASPFLIISLLSSRINLKRSKRGKQFLMLIISFLFCLPGMIFSENLANMLVRLVSYLPGLLVGIPIIGNALAVFFNNLYAALNTGYGVQLLCNTVLMAAFCIVKALALPALERVWTEDRELYHKTSGIFYWTFNSEEVLRQKYTDLRGLFNVFYKVALFLGVVDCMLVLHYNRVAAFRVPFYPVFGIILIGEILFFLDGRTAVEKNIPEDPDSDEKEVPCKDILEALVDTFQNRVGYSDQKPAPINQYNAEPWEKKLEDGDSLSQVSVAYFKALKQDLHEIEADYVLAADKLLHRKSVLIYNPFYHDMTDYVLLPIFHELLNHHSCLVICGRTTNESDIHDWLTEGINSVTNLPRLWQIEELSSNANVDHIPDIGILGFGRMFDLHTIRENGKFFERTSLVILLEPSNLLGTGQIGLRSIIQLCESGDTKPIYCILDRNTDGLVDALSHAIRQSLTEVIASPTSKSMYCRAFWRAEGAGMQTVIFPNITRYMGIGGELASHALHTGAGKAYWYSGSKMPLLDMRWVIEQYYPQICQYIHVPQEQYELDRRISFNESLWQADFGPKSFVIAEDEFCNAFEMERAFGARIREKGFVNILSESYLLRDYMYANHDLFSGDQKAIPSIVPDYARTERNFVLRTLLLMSMQPVSESVLSRELILHGYEGKHPYDELKELILIHTDVHEPRIQRIMEPVRVGVTNFSRCYYKVDQTFIDKVFHAALCPAYYIVEDEQTETYIMGNRLMDHIEQTMLPGQFFSYGGKYYQVKSISPQKGIVVRRAADHIIHRRYYRQLKSYTVHQLMQKDEAKNIRGIYIRKMQGNIDVVTDSYLEMSIRNNLPEADPVILDEVRSRKIVQKEFLQIDLKDASAEIRLAICILLNELFQTIYPTECDYLVAVIPDIPETIKNHADYKYGIRALIPDCSCKESDGGCIYLLEDSNIDLGLLVSVERNILRFLEIIADYLDWYLDPNRKHKEGKANQEFEKEEFGEENEQHQQMMDEAADERNQDDIDGEDEELFKKRKRKIKYKRNFEYLTFGYDKEPEWFSVIDARQYLNANRFLDSDLHRSRIKDPDFDEGSDYDPAIPGKHYCDFCGRVMEPGTYDVLKDGRERCTECGKDAIKTRAQFKQVYLETIQEMQDIFGIQFQKSIRVRMSNAKKVNEGFGDFHPSPGFDFRVLGYASNHTVIVENGAPRWKMKSTIVHELTHVWQYENWDSAYNRRYKKDPTVTLTTEGMAVWAEIQYLLSMGEKERAIRYKRSREIDPSVYGDGMKAFVAKYPPKEKKMIPPRKSPFGSFPPL